MTCVSTKIVDMILPGWSKLVLLSLLCQLPLTLYARDVPSIARRDSFVVEATPLARDQIGAFFEGRGFSPAVSTKIASACVMRVVVRNASTGVTIHNDLSRWRTRDKMREQPLRLEVDWQSAWASEPAVSSSAKIAFRYAMLPTEENLNPGDWLQGLVTANLAPGTEFDLLVVWTEDGKSKQAWLRDLRCAT